MAVLQAVYHLLLKHESLEVVMLRRKIKKPLHLVVDSYGVDEIVSARVSVSVEGKI